MFKKNFLGKNIDYTLLNKYNQQIDLIRHQINYKKDKIIVNPIYYNKINYYLQFIKKLFYINID